MHHPSTSSSSEGVTVLDVVYIKKHLYLLTATCYCVVKHADYCQCELYVDLSLSLNTSPFPM